MLEEDSRPEKPSFETHGQRLHWRNAALGATRGAREGSDETWNLSAF